MNKFNETYIFLYNITNIYFKDSHSEIQKESYKGYLAPGGREYAKRIMIIETGEEYPSIRACARAIGGSPSGIRQCLKKNLGSYRGFHYKLLP